MTSVWQRVTVLVVIAAVFADTVLVKAGETGRNPDCPPFPAHEYRSDLKTRWDHTNSDLDLCQAASNGNSFNVIFHGTKGAGKTALIRRLLDDKSQLTPYKPSGEPRLHTMQIGGQQIHLIDTPGFGNPTTDLQDQCLDGIDRVAQLAADTQGPVYRIYYLLDFDQARAQVPDTVIQNLQVISLAYGVTGRYDIVFVISKCDKLQSQYGRDQFVKWRQVVADMSNRFWGGNLRYDPDSVLLVSARGCMRSLTMDMVRAAGRNTSISVPGPIKKSNWINYDRLYEIMKELVEIKIKWSCGDHMNYDEPQTLKSLQQICGTIEKDHIDALSKRLLSYKQRMDVAIVESERAYNSPMAYIPVFSLMAAAFGVAGHVHTWYQRDAIEAYGKIMQFVQELNAMFPRHLCR